MVHNKDLVYVFNYLTNMTDQELKNVLDLATDVQSKDSLEEFIIILKSASDQNFHYADTMQIDEIRCFISSDVFKKISKDIIEEHNKNEILIEYWLKLYPKSSYRKYLEQDWIILCDIIEGILIRELSAGDYNTILITTDCHELTSKSFLYDRIEESHSLVLLSLYKVLYGPFNKLPLEINGIFKEVVKWRLEHEE